MWWTRTMRIRPLHTGTAEVKTAFLHARPGVRGRLALLLPGPFADPIPIRAWLIEHDEHRILVDTGEVATATDLPFSRFHVRPEDELPHALDAIGVAPSALTATILTHLHGDHMDGAVHVNGPVLVGDREWRDARALFGRVAQRITRTPVPAGVDFRPVALDAGPFGAFEHSRKLTADGRVRAVATPGHTNGHLAIVAIDDDERHVLLAGDATDSLEQLHDRRADAVAPSQAVQVATIDRILRHGREHPTIYLPTHDHDSVARLEAGTLL
jgi:N-acyl homoserine lactone hydrolase